jgi:threonine dehydrogenase-like Zn-dependent dehydrogenase
MDEIRIHRAVLYGAGDLRIEEEKLDSAALKPHEILIHTQVSGFSTGTDLGNYEGRSVEIPDAPQYPRWVGYSNVGKVAGKGELVASLAVGDRIFAAKPHCSAYVANDSEMLVKLPDGISLDQAALGYLTHLGVAGLRQVNYRPGENVCVIGLGVIGLCTVAAARAMGARVNAIANDSGRASLAQKLGAEQCYESGSATMCDIFTGQGADVVVLTANTWPAYRNAMELAAMNGRVSILGFPGRAQPSPDFNPLDARWLYGKQLTIRGTGHMSRLDCPASEIRFNVRRDLEYVFDLIASGRLDLAPVISHQIPFERMRDAYELARSHSKEMTAAVFDWRHAHGKS